MTYGMEGYGLYWYCLEEVANAVTTEKYTFELEHDAEIIAFDVRLSPVRVEEMMRYMVTLGLFENDGGVITCLKMAKRLDQSMTGNPGMRKVIERVRNHDAVMTESSSSHDSIMTESAQIRLDENRKEKESKKRVAFAPPTVREIADYCAEKGYPIDADRFFNFYESKGWYVGKTKMKSWRAAAANTQWHTGQTATTQEHIL